MDTANFPRDNPCFSLENDRKLGYFKDECAGVQPLEFVGLRAKMYSLLMPPFEKDKITAKGIKRSFVKKYIKHDTFLNCLNLHVKTKTAYSCIRSKNHLLRTLEIEKDGLNPYDDKRFILDDGITSLTYGHWRIPSL